MKSLLAFAVIAIILYAAWDMFGSSLIGSLEKATGSASESLSSVVRTEEQADFELRYDVGSGKLTITSPVDPAVNVRSGLADLSTYLRSRTSHVPLVRLIYDASVFANVEQQADFENEVRAQVEQAKGRLSLSVTGRPRAY